MKANLQHNLKKEKTILVKNIITMEKEITTISHTIENTTMTDRAIVIKKETMTIGTETTMIKKITTRDPMKRDKTTTENPSMKTDKNLLKAHKMFRKKKTRLSMTISTRTRAESQDSTITIAIETIATEITTKKETTKTKDKETMKTKSAANPTKSASPTKIESTVTETTMTATTTTEAKLSTRVRGIMTTTRRKRASLRRNITLRTIPRKSLNPSKRPRNRSQSPIMRMICWKLTATKAKTEV